MASEDNNRYGVSLDGLLTAEDANQLTKFSSERLRSVLLDILVNVEKKTQDMHNPGKHIRYTKNGFGNSVWGENQEAILNLLRQLGYKADRHEEYQQFVDISLRVEW